MTTKVKIECPDNSHWHIKVTTQDRVYDHDKRAYTDEWRTAESFVLEQTQQREVYIHDSRRLIVDEVVPEKTQ